LRQNKEQGETIRKLRPQERGNILQPKMKKMNVVHVVIETFSCLNQLTSREETSPRNIVAAVRYRLEKIKIQEKRRFDEKGKEQTRIEDRKPQGDFCDQRV